VPHRPKPKRQRFSGTMKNGAGGYCCLHPALSAMILNSRSFPRRAITTIRATKAFRPSKRYQVLSTSRFCTKPFLKFNQGSGVIFFHNQTYHMLWLLESSAYPSFNII
jgi:hypothetical protein